VAVHVDEVQAPINPLIYGQFIEHLGRCIYGGIWAEMLEDRKFYFPITAEYAPYKSLTDTPFPVVGASPWEIIGDSSHIVMDKEDSFVGEHSPRIASGAGIRQHDLALVSGKKYVGYIWLKAAGEKTTKISVTLAWGDAANQRQAMTFDVTPGDYRKFDFEFTAGGDTSKAYLEVRNEGDGSVQVGTLSLMPANHVQGMRADTLELLKQLNAPVYRWPGGNFVSGYDWRDGIGPRDRRPPRKNPAWTGVEHNDMGIDEFIAFCRAVHAEPMIAVNTGFGDAYSAAQEVEYCNRGADTIGGGWRAKNGHAEPYGVKYWCVGNEMFGPWQLGFMQLSQYTLKHREVAEKMHEVDSTIQLVGVGSLGEFNRRHDPDQKVGWTEGMLAAAADSMDYISEHFYRGRTPWAPEKPDVVKHVGLLRDSVRQKAEGHRKLQKELGLLPDRMVPIAMDEWNYWHGDYQYGELGCVYDLADAMGVAAGLHEYFRNSDIIQMAHYAQTVNVIGCIKTTKTDAFFATTALPLMLYRAQFGTLPVTVDGDFEAQGLDVAAALTQDMKVLTIGVVNPHDAPRVLQLDWKGAQLASDGQCWTISGARPDLHNAAGKPEVAIVGPQAVGFGRELTVAPFSVTLYRVELAP
jgi:alpha-N-arabinofuranosidase